MTWLPLKRVADVWPSNVDKLTIDGEKPVRLVNYTDVYYGDRLSPDLDLMSATATSDEIAKFRLRAGDVIITKDSETADDIGIPAFVEHASPEMVCGYHLSLIRPRNAHGRYLHYAISSTHARWQMSVAATGVTRFGLRSESVRALSVRVPPLAEQRAIADYLDAETARIDALIAKKQQLIHLLEEQMAVYLDEVVWSSAFSRAPLMRIVQPGRRIMYGIVLPGPDVPDGVLLVKGGNVKPGFLRPDRLARTSRDIEASYARSRLQGGDLVFAIRGGVGDLEMVPAEISGANITQDVARVAPSPGVNGRYLLHALRAPTTQRDVQERITGATIRGINIWELERITVPLPSAAEQDRVAGLLDRADQRHRRRLDLLRRQIELLGEHRQALVTAAVTGDLLIPSNR